VALGERGEQLGGAAGRVGGLGGLEAEAPFRAILTKYLPGFAAA
jgi:hypothetical protein